ncbi:MAG: hypothetical protein WBG58_12945 [Ignavibacteriaceae bacterium]
MNSEKYLSPVSKSIIINAPPNKVWDVISKPGILELCHPFCKSNPVENWAGKKSIDFVVYNNGLRYQRIFTDWIDGTGYDLLIGRRNGKKSKVIWRIKENNSSSSELKITVFPYYISKYPRIVMPVINLLVIGPQLRKYLSSVLKGFNYYIMEGKPVQKNQFGTHKWFSNN